MESVSNFFKVILSGDTYEDFEFKKAVEKRDIEKVIFLLQNSSVNLSVLNNFILKTIIMNEDAEILRIILSDHRVNVTRLSILKDDIFNFNIGNITLNGNIKIIKILLNDQRFDLNILNSYIIRRAIKDNDPELIELLLQNQYFDINTLIELDDSYILSSIMREQVEIVKLFLKDRRFDLSQYNMSIIHMADTEIFKLLLNDHRFNSVRNKNRIFRIACEKNYIEIVKFLLLDPSINPFSNNNFCMDIAMRNNYTELINILREDQVKYPTYEIRKNNLLLDLKINKLIEEEKKYLEMIYDIRKNYAHREYKNIIKSGIIKSDIIKSETISDANLESLRSTIQKLEKEKIFR